MEFTKMHGLGNNYILFNLLENSLPEEDLSNIAKAVSNVNFGIGSDGMILICPSDKGDFLMRIFNADGSEGKNCGNGLRCVAKYLFDHHYVETTTFSIETLGGMMNVVISSRTGKVADMVTVNMGKPKLLKGTIPMKGDPHTTTINETFLIDGKEFSLTSVSMGNPHAILFVDDVFTFPLVEIGPIIECADLFPERVNVGIATVKNKNEIDYRVWERGSGLTMACGTGACATVVAATLNKKIAEREPITVHLPGGDLEIWIDERNQVWKKGRAEYICHGVINLDSLL